MQPPGFLESHLADMRLRGLAEDTTIYARRCAVSRLATALDVPVEDAADTDLLAWRKSLTVSTKSVGPYVDHIRGYYAFLVRSGYRSGNPAADLPVPRGHRSLPRPISENDLDRAFASAPRRVRPWLALAAGAGLRAVEIAYLRRENVHDTALRPFLLIAEEATKGHRERTLGMSAFVLDELRAAGLPSRGWVFPRHDGRPGPNKPWLISKLANDHLHRSGTGATLHQLRHRCLTLLYDETLDLRLVQEIAGHESPATTAIYTRVNNVRAADALNALPAPKRLRAAG